MKTKTLSLKINTTNPLLVAFDVGKSVLNLYFEVPNKEYSLEGLWERIQSVE